MAVTNDGFGNYFSGNQSTGVTASELLTDVQSILTTLSIPFFYNSSDAGQTIAYRPVLDSLTGSITAASAPLTTNAVSTNARFNILLFRANNISTNITTLINANSSNTSSVVTARLNTTGYTGTNLAINIATGASCWACITANSVSYFYNKDVNNYLLISSGFLDNLGSAYSYPRNAFAFYTGKYLGTKLSSFGTADTNQTTLINILKAGALDTQLASANYPHLVASGSQGLNSFLGLRRTDNDYMIGTIPNIIKAKSTAGYAINDIVELNNITQGNNSILGSTNNTFKVVGRLDSTSANDDLGDFLLMRVKKV
jgi:hypothetical protein